MKTILVTDFRKNTSSFINEVEHGETLILIRRGKPVAEIIPFSDRPKKNSLHGNNPVYDCKSKVAICPLPYWKIVSLPYETGC